MGFHNDQETTWTFFTVLTRPFFSHSKHSVTEEKVVGETELCGFQEHLFFSGSTLTRVGHGEIIDDVIGDVIEKSVQSTLLIYDFYNHWRQKNTIEI